MAIEVINGARRNFGPRLTESRNGGKTRTAGETVELVYDFNYNTLPTTSATDNLVPVIPAGAVIIDAVLFVKTAFVGGTSIEVGTWTTAGVAVDADGIIPAAVGVTANLLLNSVIAGRGVQVYEAPDAAGTAHADSDGIYASGANGPVASVDSQVAVVAVGTFTAGAAKLVLRYIVKQ